MGKIRMLSDALIGMIAAGEVVERPVSAMKELIENSLDAGASAVTAEIREGGLSYIRVTDNGSGIDESDLRLAFERHATSKISGEPDLFSIRTLGFRGEALASIAAVSHVVMTTRTAANDTGLKVTNEGGRILKIEETACTVGTTITVTDLFFNTPVRKGFMKKPSAEAVAVTELMNQFALSRPDVSFRYINEGKVMLHSPGDGQYASAAMTVFGARAMKAMKEVNGRANGILLKGYVGIGENARGNRGQEFFFINGRMMHSSILSAALETACRERVMIGKFPVCALQMTIAYETVDVNVHPNKLEVRFRDEAAVGEAVVSIIIEALKEKDAFDKPVQMALTKGKDVQAVPVPAQAEIRKSLEKLNASGNNAVVAVTDRIPEIPEKPTITESPVMREAAEELKPFIRPGTEKQGEVFRAGQLETECRPGVLSPEGSGQREPLPETAGQKVQSPETSVQTGLVTEVPIQAVAACRQEKAEQVNTILPEIRKTMRIFGALFNTYILVEYEDQLLMVDQHAVHERLLFDRLMKEQSGQNMGQELLVPIIVSVSGKEQALIEENRQLLESIGLMIESFGAHEAAVRMIPMVLGETETAGFVRDVLNEIESAHAVTMEKKRADLLQAACKHAVKGGEALGEDQLRSILDEMISRKVTPTCPHGRPLVVAITHRELDRKFKRIQG